MPARLNRRRYREVVTMLKQVISDPKATTKQRLQAADTLLEVYRRHDQTEQRKEARKRPAETPSESESTEPQEQQQNVPQTREDAERAAREFLDRIKQKESQNVG